MTIETLAEYMATHATPEDARACLRALDTLQDAPADSEEHALLLELAVALAYALVTSEGGAGR